MLQPHCTIRNPDTHISWYNRHLRTFDVWNQFDTLQCILIGFLRGIAFEILNYKIIKPRGTWGGMTAAYLTAGQALLLLNVLDEQSKNIDSPSKALNNQPRGTIHRSPSPNDKRSSRTNRESGTQRDHIDNWVDTPPCTCRIKRV